MSVADVYNVIVDEEQHGRASATSRSWIKKRYSENLPEHDYKLL